MATKHARILGAERDLEWLFVCGDGVMGLHAGDMEPSGSALSWDAARLERLHLGRLDWEHKRSVAQHGRIRACFFAMPAKAQAIVTATFAPRPYDAALRTAAGTVGVGSTLAGLIVVSDEAHGLFAEQRKRAPRGHAEVERLLGDLARSEARGKVFGPLVRAARATLDEALGEYATLAWAQAQDRKERRAADLARFRASLG